MKPLERLAIFSLLKKEPWIRQEQRTVQRGQVEVDVMLQDLLNSTFTTCAALTEELL